MALTYGMTHAPSTCADLSVRKKLVDNLLLVRHRICARAEIPNVFAEPIPFAWLGPARNGVRVFEIGYGARPYRLLALHALGYDAEGVDVEVPLLRPTVGAHWRVLRTNGFERFAKTLGRSLLVDRRERRAFVRACEGKCGAFWRLDAERFLVGDAAAHEPTAPYGLVYSVDVFEHMTPASLERVAALLPSWLEPSGVAVIQIDIWTGIEGGHLLQPHRRPWEHLRVDCRYRANTTLNHWRRKHYRDLFARHLEVVAELETELTPPDRLTPQLRSELVERLGYSELELLAARPIFVLRRHCM
jgi:hypothetical protein